MFGLRRMKGKTRESEPNGNISFLDRGRVGTDTVSGRVHEERWDCVLKSRQQDLNARVSSEAMREGGCGQRRRGELPLPCVAKYSQRAGCAAGNATAP